MTKHFAPVCGAQVYQALFNIGRLPNYNLLLAHDILKRPEEYAKVFRPYTSTPHVTILDNSITELGTAVDIQTIANAAYPVQANVIVLPDVYEDWENTITSCTLAYDKWQRDLRAALGSPNQGQDNWSYMLVPQGKTPQEYIQCLEAFPEDKFPLIRWIGVPRNLAFHHGTRDHGVRISRILSPNREIHMLGFSDNVYDDLAVAQRYPFIRGIDSAVPMRLASDGELMTWGLGKIDKRKEGWLETAPYTAQMLTNMEYVAHIINA